MGPHDALHQWHSADPQEFPGRYQSDSTYQAQCCIAVVTVVSELALDLKNIESKFELNSTKVEDNVDLN